MPTIIQIAALSRDEIWISSTKCNEHLQHLKETDDKLYVSVNEHEHGAH